MNVSSSPKTEQEDDSVWCQMRREMTLEALADVDAGRIISHECVQAWADSLDKEKPLPVPRWPHPTP